MGKKGRKLTVICDGRWMYKAHCVKVVGSGNKYIQYEVKEYEQAL